MTTINELFNLAAHSEKEEITEDDIYSGATFYGFFKFIKIYGNDAVGYKMMSGDVVLMINNGRDDTGWYSKEEILFQFLKYGFEKAQYTYGRGCTFMH